jgi:transposase
MTDYREILRLNSLGINKANIAASYECSRNTVASALKLAKAYGLKWPLPDNMSNKDLAEKLYPLRKQHPAYKMQTTSMCIAECRRAVYNFK